jgi:hypothetical protein
MFQTNFVLNSETNAVFSTSQILAGTKVIKSDAVWSAPFDTLKNKRMH